MKVTVILLFIIACIRNFGQSNEDLIQFSGTVLTVTRDSLAPVPYVLVKNKSRQSGAFSNFEGFFTLVVARNDTLEFTSVGFKKRTLIVPNNIKNSKFFASQIIMIRDTNSIHEVIIVPWKNVDELKRAFVDLELNEDDIIKAYQNIQLEHWKEMSASVKYDGQEMQANTLNIQNQNLRMQQGLAPANNLINPLSWMQFIDYLSKSKKTKAKNYDGGKFENQGN